MDPDRDDEWTAEEIEEVDKALAVLQGNVDNLLRNVEALNIRMTGVRNFEERGFATRVPVIDDVCGKLGIPGIKESEPVLAAFLNPQE